MMSELILKKRETDQKYVWFEIPRGVDQTDSQRQLVVTN